MRLHAIMTTKRRVPFLVLAGMLALAGCGSSDPDYYTLKPWPGSALAGGPLTLKIETPSVAGYLDRDYIVADDRSYKLKLDGDAAWGEPLGGMIGQTLAQDLQQRLPGTTVFTQSGAISTEAQATLELNVARFSKTRDGDVEITAALSVQRADHGDGAPPAQAQTIHLTMTPTGTGMPALVASLSQLLGQVADQAAQDARALGPAPIPVASSLPPG
jgi:uncharacterized lipoprotein YmbA